MRREQDQRAAPPNKRALPRQNKRAAPRQNITPDQARCLYQSVRSVSQDIVAGLAPEDMVPQPFAEASPLKWHLGHTTWFFETFLLSKIPDYVPFRGSSPAGYRGFFNSYYDSVGDRPLQRQRGMMTRPGVAEIFDYRAHVDRAMEMGLASGHPHLLAHLELGLAHEEQHQELMLTDGLALLATNPLRPCWRKLPDVPQAKPVKLAMVPVSGGLGEMGVDYGDLAFCYDNETPRHRVWVDDFKIANRLVTNGEYLEFIEAGGYRKPLLWQADGWDLQKAEGWQAPFYWHLTDLGWAQHSWGGLEKLAADAPVFGISWFEADAFARWASYRLIREAEWERAANLTDRSGGNFLDAGYWRPIPAAFLPATSLSATSMPDDLSIMPDDGPANGRGQAIEHSTGLAHGQDVTKTSGPIFQMYGDGWEWTDSAHHPYPHWKPLKGAFGEYNGKFMSGRMVLKGGSWATPKRHCRPSYRNFWWPGARWQASAIRLAEDA